jgi:hypothetical protein
MFERLMYGSTVPITDGRRRPLPGSIAALERITLGGVSQSVLICAFSARFSRMRCTTSGWTPLRGSLLIRSTIRIRT